MISLGSPVLFAVALVVALVAFTRLRHLKVRKQPRRRILQALTALALVFAVCAAGDLGFRRRMDRMALVFVLDRSRSLEESEPGLRRELAAAAAARIQDQDRVGLVLAAEGADTEAAPSETPSFSQASQLGREGTDLAAGVRRALAELPAEYSGRIVLISDGLQTSGDVLHAAEVAGQRGVAVDVFPVPRDATPEVAVERVRVPDTAHEGEPVQVRVLVRSTEETTARIRLLVDGVPSRESVVNLRAGVTPVEIEVEAGDIGLHRFQVEVTPTDDDADTSLSNNSGGALLQVAGESRILVVADDAAEVTPLLRAFEDQDIEVSVTGPDAFPRSVVGLAGYDLLVLHDVRARSFSVDQLTVMRSFVRDTGGGLFMIGARESFGVGGYVSTPVEEALPVRLDLRERRDRASFSMVIAIDQSGSMGAMVGSRTKLDLANEAAFRSAELLSRSDRLGVMHVDTSVHWTLPLGDMSHGRADAIRRAAVGGGGILVRTALDASFAALRRESSQLKHMLLFSDGNDSAEMTGTERLVRDALADGITTSVVSMGNGVDTAALERLSTLGGGRFYIVTDMRSLPTIFTEETMQASRAALSRDPFTATRGESHQITRGLDLSSAPQLLGHAIVVRKPRSRVLLWAAEDEPLLAAWRYGLGRSAVFTTDLGVEFGQPWRDLDLLTTLLDRTSRTILRETEARASFGVEINGSEGTIFMDVVEDGEAQDDLALSANVSRPQGGSQEVVFHQVSPGRYEATFDASEQGGYVVGVLNDATGEFLGSGGAVRSGGGERLESPTDRVLLEQVAQLSGGRVLDHIEDSFDVRPSAVSAHESKAPLMLVLALLCFTLALVLRRFGLPGARDGLRPEVRARRAVRSTAESNASTKPARRTKPKAENKTSAGVPANPEAPKASEGSESESVSDAPPSTLAERLLAGKKARDE